MSQAHDAKNSGFRMAGSQPKLLKALPGGCSVSGLEGLADLMPINLEDRKLETAVKAIQAFPKLHQIDA